MKKNLLTIAAALFCMSIAVAQDAGNSNNSVRPVHTSDVMYKKSVTRAIDLREKQNLPLFSRNREITKLLIDAVMNGTLQSYENDSLNSKLTIDEFTENLRMPNEAGIPDDTNECFLLYGADWKSIVKEMKNDFYSARDLYQLEIKENIIFDNNRSRMYYEIQSITVYIPSDNKKNIKAVQLPIATFSYKEIVENLFKDNPKAIWFNSQNDQEHKNLADAFDLRLFSSYLIKVSNANDAYLSDLYQDQKTGIMASSWAAQELLEYEHNLWEF